MVQQVFYCPSKIITGDGCAAALGAEARALGARKVWLVTDKVLREKTEYITAALAALQAAGIASAVFDEVEPDPLVATALRSTELARAFDPGVIVGIGGGSALDIAKATAIFLTNDLPLEKMWGRGNVPKRGRPLILLPTTGGTGSEASTSCVLTDVLPTGAHLKRSVVSSCVVPDIAIVDPLLTLTVPPLVTAATGLDALTHAIESYVSKEASPLTDVLGMEATRLIGKYLRRAVANGGDLEARRGMSNAALMAGLAFSNGQLGIVHAIAMVIGGLYNVPHGVANALMLPYVMEFNEMAATYRFAQIAEALGERIAGLSERDAAHRATLAVRRLADDVGIPRRLSEVNIPKEAIPGIAAEVFKNERLRGVNPRGSTLKDLVGILERAAAA